MSLLDKTGTEDLLKTFKIRVNVILTQAKEVLIFSECQITLIENVLQLSVRRDIIQTCYLLPP